LRWGRPGAAPITAFIFLHTDCHLVAGLGLTQARLPALTAVPL
jgi:hypothetical protein